MDLIPLFATIYLVYLLNLIILYYFIIYCRGQEFFFPIVPPFHSRKQRYNIHFPTMLCSPKMILYSTNKCLKALPIYHKKGNFNKT